MLGSVIEEFLTALCDPDGGETLHRLHTADALIRHADSIRPAADIDPVSFGRSHREISVRGQGILPQFGNPRLLQQAPAPDDAEAVVWFQVTEMREQRSVIAGIGLRSTGTEGPRIGWCTLAARVEPWSYQDGMLQTLADYPWMRRTEPAPARAMLDAGYFRRHWHPQLRFNSLPDARFSCQMSAVCCKHDFEITLPPEAQLLIDAMPWPSLAPRLCGTRLPVRADGTLQLKALNEPCRFLGERRQCLIHQKLGRQPFGPCAIFPFAFAQTPEGIAVALSPICGSTRLGLGLAPADCETDLRERLAQAQPRATDHFRIAPGREVSWEDFRDAEQGLLNCLAARDLPLRRRLSVGARFLGALARKEPLDTNLWLSEPPATISRELREAVRGMLQKVLAWDRGALQTLPSSLPPGLFELEVREPPIMTRILQNTLFSKVYSYPFDLTTAFNFLIVLYLLALIMQAASDEPLSDVMWQELGSLGVHGLLRNMLHEGVPEGFRTLFGTSEFGSWMLAA